MSDSPSENAMLTPVPREVAAPVKTVLSAPGRTGWRGDPKHSGDFRLSKGYCLRAARAEP